MDIPVIKPRTTYNNRNEFNVLITKTAVGVSDTANMTLFPKPVLVEAQQTILADLRAEIESLKNDLKTEQDVLNRLREQEIEAQSKKSNEAPKRKSPTSSSSDKGSKRDDKKGS